MESLDELKKAGRPLLNPRKSLAEEAAEALRELILLEKLKPGTPVPERDLASILGISRTPLREALKILEHEGLVEYSLTRRPFIANPSLIELADLIKVIGALESLAGELACDRANPEEIDSISSLADAMSAKSDKIDPWRHLVGPWAPLVVPWAPKLDFRPIGGSIRTPMLELSS